MIDKISRRRVIAAAAGVTTALAGQRAAPGAAGAAVPAEPGAILRAYRKMGYALHERPVYGWMKAAKYGLRDDILTPLNTWVCIGMLTWLSVAASAAEPDTDISALRRATQLVNDVDAVLPFYRDLLGFRVVYDLENTNPAQLRLIGIQAKRTRVVALQSPRRDIPGGLVGLVQILDPVPNIDFSVGNRVALLLLTDDARALYDRLEQAGVTMLSDLESYEAARTPGVTLAFTVADPAGTRISFAQIVGPPPE
jgi:catechol 2,3-dioxygenase-like lactoylglutathione lyase family enzyme